MARKVDNLRMTVPQAEVEFANDYILMQMDNDDLECDDGVVIGVGEEIALLHMKRKEFVNRNNCFLFSGINRRDSLGGLEISV